LVESKARESGGATILTSIGRSSCMSFAARAMFHSSFHLRGLFLN
jgi:hypothetical protein